MSNVEGSKKGLPRRGAVKERIFANIVNGIKGSFSRASPEAAGGAEAEAALPNADQHSGPLDTSMMVKAS